VLGRDDGCELRVTAPPQVEELSLTASAGRIENVRRLPGGGFTARFRAPAERVPQVAIVSALGRSVNGLDDGWIAIPLSGEGDARVRGEPGSPVTLRVGDRTFGPVTAGPDGVAIVPVVVPPGVREAHQGFRPIDLRVPEKPLLHVVQDRTIVRADREEKVRVLAYVVAPHGVARRGDQPAFEPTRGTVAVTEREPGAFQAVWTLPRGAAGEERLTVRLPFAPASRSVLRVDAAAGPPAVVAVSFDRDALVAGSEAAVVTARVLDGGGNVVAADLELSAHGALLSEVQVRRPGEVVARLSAGPILSADEAVVTAAAEGVGISGARALPLRPGAPAGARFHPREPVLRSDGTREALLRVSVADRYGNPVAASPVVTAARGRVLEVAERARGEYAVRYVGPAVERASPEELVARVGPVRAVAAPVLAPPGPALLVSGRAGAAGDARGRFVGPSAGLAAEGGGGRARRAAGWGHGRRVRRPRGRSTSPARAAAAPRSPGASRRRGSAAAAATASRRSSPAPAHGTRCPLGRSSA
jgi:hypothetical protein